MKQNQSRGIRTHRTSMAVFVVFLSTFVFASHIYGEWQNPSEKYIDAYKEYLDAACPLVEDDIKHYVYFARDREAIRKHPFLNVPRFEGAQIMYSWRQLEPSRGEYDFSPILEDFRYLESHDKKLFVQLQDATFDTRYIGVPNYLLSDEFDGGAIYQRNESGEPEGWVAKRWNSNMQERFRLLLLELGKTFDGRIAGINLQESAISVTVEFDLSFSPELYVESLKTNMLALKNAFPNSVTMQYANFMPGEWLPWEDSGYLRSIYIYGEEIGVGLGAPDLMVQRKGQLNHALTLMHEGEYRSPLGIAVQDGNYIGLTGADGAVADDVIEERKNLVPMLHAFAKEFLRVDFMFWTYQEPYFSEDAITCFIGQ